MTHDVFSQTDCAQVTWCLLNNLSADPNYQDRLTPAQWKQLARFWSERIELSVAMEEAMREVQRTVEEHQQRNGEQEIPS